MPPPGLDSVGPAYGGAGFDSKRFRLRNLLRMVQDEIDTDGPPQEEPKPPSWGEQRKAGVPFLKRTNAQGVTTGEHLLYSLGDVAAALAGANNTHPATATLYGRKAEERTRAREEKDTARKEKGATLRSLLPGIVAAALKEDEGPDPEKRTTADRNLDIMESKEWFKALTPEEQQRLREGVLGIPNRPKVDTPKDIESDAYLRRIGAGRAELGQEDPNAKKQTAAMSRYIQLTTEPGNYPTPADPQGWRKKVLTHEEAMDYLRREQRAGTGIEEIYPRRTVTPPLAPPPAASTGTGAAGDGAPYFAGGTPGAEASLPGNPTEFDSSSLDARYPGLSQFINDHPGAKIVMPPFGEDTIRGNAYDDMMYRPPAPGAPPAPAPTLPMPTPMPGGPPMGVPMSGSFPQGRPPDPMTGQPMDAAKLFQLINGFQALLRQGKPREDLIRDFQRQYGFDPTRFEGAFSTPGR
jgi:hypothetical protein